MFITKRSSVINIYLTDDLDKIYENFFDWATASLSQRSFSG